MTGRPPPSHGSLSPSLSRTISHLRLEDIQTSEPVSPGETVPTRDDPQKILAQVQLWLNEEKAKLTPKVNGAQDASHSDPSVDSSHDAALAKLEKILGGVASGSIAVPPTEIRPKKSHSQSSFRRGSLAKAFKRTAAHSLASSDTEWQGEDIHVPHVEAYLDNSKTMAFTGGAAYDDLDAAQQRDSKHWEQFKQEIVRLTHTLKIRGWRRIPIEKGEIISVERLSGALTNAVYVVKPPAELPEPDENVTSKPYLSKSKPKELLLRIYGPQVEHLIDRETELSILARLARKKIGPRLLGYFTNGRFEEYLHAKTLSAEDIRIPETMKQIAKRMRELHDGIDLLPSEREGGPTTFNNWDKTVDRCETVITYLDSQVKLELNGSEPSSKRYTRRGFVCGVEWPVFKKTFEKYRKMVIAECGGNKAVKKRLVFAHNDAQYGNLMRLDPPGDSPLMQPANQHRQLVVIDFEYAGANTRGFEFANHFTEWCYNYHQENSYACNTKYYPTRQEQQTFLRAYVMHRPQFTPAASSTPKMEGREKTNISDFMLDARTPTGAAAMDYDEEERAREEKVEHDIQLLIRETRLWRIARSAQWAVWGIVQAKVPELEDPPKKSKTARLQAAFDKVRGHIYPQSDPLDEDVKALQEASKHDRPETRAGEEAHAEGDSEDEEVEDFDYLGYAHDRAMFFWGDCLTMGLVKEEELPESLMKQIKIVDY